MWLDNGINIGLEEGKYWLNNHVIKAFDKNGDLCNLFRIKISDTLEISCHEHKDYKKNIKKSFETWEQTLNRNLQRINNMEHESIQLLKKYGLNTDRKIVDTNSTGKDSMVKSYLAKKAGLSFETYFNVTTLDVPESNKMAKMLNFKFTTPEKKYGGFYQYISKTGEIPSRVNRFCCNYFKESATANAFDINEKLLILLGMRNSESKTRSTYADTWVGARWNNRDWIGLLPIRKWTDLDVWLYIFKERININPKYRYGYERVGCGIACPNYSKTTWVLDKYYYPKMFDRWRKILREDFIKNNKWIIMNCTVEEYLNGAWTGGIYRNYPTEDVVTEYSLYNGLDMSIAKNYFNRYCMNGCLTKNSKPLKIKDKETLSMNLKMYGRNIDKFFCKKCLMSDLEIDEEKWNHYVRSFKNQGCELF